VRHWSGCLCVFGVKSWVGISGQGGDGHRAMDKVCENPALLRGVLFLSTHLLLDQRDKEELIS